MDTSKFTDKVWVDKLLAAGAINSLSMSLGRPDIAYQKRQYFEGILDKPNLLLGDVKSHKLHDITEHRSKLSSLYLQVSVNEADKLLRELYMERIAELILKHNMLEASITGDWQSFSLNGQYLYGEVDRHLAESVRLHFESFVQNLSTKVKDKSLQSLVDVFLGFLNEHRSLPEGFTPKPLYEWFPDEAIVHQISAIFYAKHHALTKEVGQLPKNISVNRLKLFIQKALDEYAPEYQLVVKESDILSFRIGQKNFSLVMNKPQSAYVHKDRVLGLVVGHEIGVHIMRKRNAMLQPYGLLWYGLDRYESSEEGLGVLAEQAIYSSLKRSLISHRSLTICGRYYAAAMASGVFGRKYGFNDVFRFFEVFFEIVRLTRTDTKKTQSYAKEMAWTLTEKTFRGTPGQDGIYFARPSTYLPANIGVWRAFAADQSLIPLSDRGKFDISNQRHLELVKRIVE